MFTKKNNQNIVLYNFNQLNFLYFLKIYIKTFKKKRNSCREQKKMIYKKYDYSK